MPVCAREAAKGGDQEQEDTDKNDVSAEGTDHVDEAEEAHPDLEESCAEGTSQLHIWRVLGGRHSLPKLALNSGFSVPVV